VAYSCEGTFVDGSSRSNEMTEGHSVSDRLSTMSGVRLVSRCHEAGEYIVAGHAAQDPIVSDGGERHHGLESSMIPYKNDSVAKVNGVGASAGGLGAVGCSAEVTAGVAGTPGHSRCYQPPRFVAGQNHQGLTSERCQPWWSW
jgi:hypothetical protein